MHATTAVAAFCRSRPASSPAGASPHLKCACTSSPSCIIPCLRMFLYNSLPSAARNMGRARDPRGRRHSLGSVASAPTAAPIRLTIRRRAAPHRAPPLSLLRPSHAFSSLLEEGGDAQLLAARVEVGAEALAARRRDGGSARGHRTAASFVAGGVVATAEPLVVRAWMGARVRLGWGTPCRSCCAWGPLSSR